MIEQDKQNVYGDATRKGYDKKTYNKARRKGSVIALFVILILVVVMDAFNFVKWTENALTVFLGMAIVTIALKYIEHGD